MAKVELLGTIFIGRLFAYKQLFIGPEFYVNLGSPSSNWVESANLLFPAESLSTNTTNQLNTVDLGIDGRLGLLTNIASLLYGRIGVSFNKLSSTISIIDSRPTIPLEVTTSDAASHNLVGARIGAGFEQTITPSFSVRGDYIFTYYPSTSKFFASPARPADDVLHLGPISNTTTIRVNTNVALISLVYHWDTHHEK